VVSGVAETAFPVCRQKIKCQLPQMDRTRLLVQLFILDAWTNWLMF